MLLEDRIAFACTYLSNVNLSEYIEEVTEYMVESGGLEGLLLTGLTHDGMQLLENYITTTSDVQTAVLLILATKVLYWLTVMLIIAAVEDYLLSFAG